MRTSWPHALPGVFCAGEMLDWEAPTGGYLLTASMASGRVAGVGRAALAGASCRNLSTLERKVLAPEAPGAGLARQEDIAKDVAYGRGLRDSAKKKEVDEPYPRH